MGKRIMILSMVMGLLFGLSGTASAMNSEESSSSVSSIYLKGSGQSITWQATGRSENGFKVVWSKNRNPEYPNREGDKYHYFESASKTSDTLEAFSGAGVYFVRVCEYLGDKCGTYSNQIELALGEKSSVKSVQKSEKDEAKYASDDYEKIPDIDSIRYYAHIKKEGDSLYGIKIENILKKKNLEKILSIGDIKYFKNIEKIGDSLYGVRIENTRKIAVEKKIVTLQEQLKKIMSQIEMLQKELSQLN